MYEQLKNVQRREMQVSAISIFHNQNNWIKLILMYYMAREEIILVSLLFARRA